MSREANSDRPAAGAGQASPTPGRRQLPPEVQETVKIMAEIMLDSRRRELAALADAERQPRRRGLLAGVSPKITRARDEDGHWMAHAGRGGGDAGDR